MNPIQIVSQSFSKMDGRREKNVHTWEHICRDANLAKRFAVFLGLKRSISDEKSSIFTHCAIHMCRNKIKEKQHFPKSCSISEVFS